MSFISKIEWTGATWNPMRGCNRVGPDCDHCYMMTHAQRFVGTPGHPYELGSKFRLVPGSLTLPLKWTAPTKVFVNSMSDFFHPKAPTEYLVDCARVMGAASWHIYQVLTKRSALMREMLSQELRFAAELDHVWWGVSAGVRAGLPRIDDLRAAPAKRRFLSLEPLLEDLGTINLNGISWVIVGGESGPGARPIQYAWVANIRDQCWAAGVPFFFKQWGGVHKGRTGRTLDGVVHDEFPVCAYGPLKGKAERTALIAEIERKYGLYEKRSLVLH